MGTTYSPSPEEIQEIVATQSHAAAHRSARIILRLNPALKVWRWDSYSHRWKFVAMPSWLESTVYKLTIGVTSEDSNEPCPSYLREYNAKARSFFSLGNIYHSAVYPKIFHMKSSYGR